MFDLTIEGEKIHEIDLIADPQRLGQLELTFLDG